MMNQLQSQMPPAPVYPPQASQWSAVLFYFPGEDPEEVPRGAALPPTFILDQNQGLIIISERDALPHL